MTTLMVATTGGHLAQLFALAKRMPELDQERLWVTFESRQGETLLADEEHVYIPYIAERDVLGVSRGLAYARRLIRSRKVTAVVSTGSAIALSFLPYAALSRIDAFFIESAARVSRPSLTGRVLQHLPGIRLYRQYPQAVAGPWGYGGSVFEGFEPVAAPPDRQIRRVVVTVGMERPFRRLLLRALAVVPPDVEVLWQTGPTPVDDLPLDAQPFVATAELETAMRSADLVIAHAGCGSAIAALEAGKLPILVARDPRHGEVVDDHQREIADLLDSQGLAIGRTPETLRAADLEAAAARAVRQRADPPPFRLVGQP
jgi:UDP-N-acetylglucosamine--N-acetylmuramyl-(pentapeptide) pyrophosphoryl-undecaprenol N-acetylglucosamine transferase